MNVCNAYRRARNALCFEKSHFSVTVQLDNIEAKNCRKIKVLDPRYTLITIKILVPDFPSWSRQIQIYLPHQLRTRQTANIMFIYGLVWRQRNVCCTIELACVGLQPAPHVADGHMRQRARYDWTMATLRRQRPCSAVNSKTACNRFLVLN